jgi:hypothetical protein
MSKIIYAVFRSKNIPETIHQKVEEICKELNPDNIQARPAFIFRDQKVIFGLTNPPSTFLHNKENVVLGNFFESDENWKKIGHPASDGNYIIFRSNPKILEVVSDYMGTRNLWYFFNEDFFIASSSQKALIHFSGDFIFDEGIIPWILFNGTTGPNNCWDKRLKRIPPNAKITIDKKKWVIKIDEEPVQFSPSKNNKEHFKQELKTALTNTFKDLNIEPEKWAITLSGGHDSRAVLSLFKKYHNQESRDEPARYESESNFKNRSRPEGIKPTGGNKKDSTINTVTWGERKSLQDLNSDAHIAQLLADRHKTAHKYYSTEDTEEPIEKIVTRFLANGEGGIDHITGYLDGFSIWQELFENRIEGIIRGDEVFGYNTIYSTLVVRNFMGLLFFEDYENLTKYEYLKSLKQELPSHLNQTESESLPTWRDRIFQEYRIPYAQASLADLKYPYVEQLNPFLSRKIAKIIRGLPDKLRTDKKLFKEIMKSLNPKGIPFSKKDSNTPLRDAVKKEEFVDLIKKELSSNYAEKFFPKSFLNQLILNLKVKEISSQNESGIFKKLKEMVPKKVKTYLAHQNPKLQLDENVLAFRVFIICRMHKTFSEIK